MARYLRPSAGWCLWGCRRRALCRIVEALRATGIENDVHIYNDTQHGFWLYVDWDWANNLALAADAWHRLKDYIRRVLGSRNKGGDGMAKKIWLGGFFLRFLGALAIIF